MCCLFICLTAQKSVFKKIYSLKPASFQSDNKHTNLSQCVKARDKFMHPSPHPQFLR